MSEQTETLPDFVDRYFNAVGRHGPGSLEAKAVRATTTDPKMLEYADALDRVKRQLGGKGMEPRS